MKLSLREQRIYKRGQIAKITGSEEENLFNKNNPKGQIDLLYKLHKETKEIFSITGYCSTF
jgi:hypothetical protein